MNVKELCYLLKSATSVEEIDNHRNDIANLIPKVSIMFDYDQHNHAHQYDLWYHTLHTILNLPRNLEDDMLYLGAMLHDIGKPDARCDGKKPDDHNWHYYGHPEVSYRIVKREIIPLLFGEISKVDSNRLLYYVKHHDDTMSLKIKHLRKFVRENVSLEDFKKLMILEVADAKAHILIPVVVERIEVCTKWSSEYADEMYSQIVEEERRIAEKRKQKGLV